MRLGWGVAGQVLRIINGARAVPGSVSEWSPGT